MSLKIQLLTAVTEAFPAPITAPPAGFTGPVNGEILSAADSRWVEMPGYWQSSTDADGFALRFLDPGNNGFRRITYFAKRATIWHPNFGAANTYHIYLDGEFYAHVNVNPGVAGASTEVVAASIGQHAIEMRVVASDGHYALVERIAFVNN